MNVSVPAGEERVFPAIGYFFYIVASTGPLDVELLNHDQTTIETREALVAGQGLGDKKPVRFEQVRFINRGSSDVSVDYYAGKLGMFDKRVLGTVSVSGVVSVSEVPEGGKVYSSIVGATAAAGYYGYVELHNPAGSGVVATLLRLDVRKKAGALIAHKIKGPASPVPTEKEPYPVAGGVGESVCVFSGKKNAASRYDNEYGLGSGGNAKIAWASGDAPAQEVIQATKGVTIEEGESIVMYQYSVNEMVELMIAWEERQS